jgi:tryptophan-rich sensory protein
MKDSIRFIIAVAAPLIVGGLSGFATSSGVETWFPTLVKPAFNPPSWVFGPVWTVLYVLMGVAAFLVWNALNGLWSILFFGMQSPGLAFMEIIVLWLAIAATIGTFWRVTQPAAWLLLPYLAWVSFAAVLNGSIWMLNR